MEQVSRHDVARDEAAIEYANRIAFTEEMKEFAYNDFKAGWEASYKYFQSINTRVVTADIHDTSDMD